MNGNSYMDNLQTFIHGDWPAGKSTKAEDLSRAGFVFSRTVKGNGSVERYVRCPSCHIEESGWYGKRDPMKVHQELSPACPFVKALQEREARLNGDSQSIQPSAPPLPEEPSAPLEATDEKPPSYEDATKHDLPSYEEACRITNATKSK